MNECAFDCLSCRNSMSIPREDMEYDELYCCEHERIVDENHFCLDYN